MLATTELFVELLVIGLSSLYPIALLTVAVFGITPDDLKAIAGWEGAVLVATLALAYLSGVVIDRIADSAFEKWDTRLSSEAKGVVQIPPAVAAASGDPSEAEMRLVVWGGPEAVINYFLYARSRRRLSRATVIVGFATALTSSGLFVLQWLVTGAITTSLLPAKLLIASVAVGLLLALGALYSWRKTGQMYHEHLRRAYLLQVEP